METFLVERLFWVLLIVAAFPLVPFWWSLFACFLTYHLNSTPFDYQSAVSIDFGNMLSRVVLPSILLLRTRFAGLKLLGQNGAFRLWILFVAYCIAAVYWSPFPLPAIKQVGYLYVHSVTLAVLVYAFQRDKEKTYRTLLWLLCSALVIAFVQTVLAGNPRGFVGNRFTSFTSPQMFGVYLTFNLALILSFSRQNAWCKKRVAFWVPVLMVALYFNGSRAAVAGALVLLAWYGLVWSRRGNSYPRLGLVLACFSIGVLAVWALLAGGVLGRSGVYAGSEPNRMAEAANVVLGRNAFADVGTFRFRLEMAHVIIDQFQRKPIKELILGSGTSSVGEMVTLKYIWYRGYDEFTVDANRMAHNEFLRVIYEWGLVGGLLFSLFLIYLLVGAVRITQKERSFEGWMPTASVFVIVFVFFSTENILSASGTPMGMAITAILGFLATLNLKGRPPLESSLARSVSKGLALGRNSVSQRSSPSRHGPRPIGPATSRWRGA